MFCASPLSQTARAQVGGGIGFGQSVLYRQVREAAVAMRKYRCAHGHLPQQSSELDEALHAIFRRVSMTQENPAITPQSRNNYRVYYQFAIAYDSSVRAVPVINGRVIVPNNWSAPPNTVTVLSDGADMFAVWAASGDYKPINDPTTNNPLVILETVTCDESAK